MTANLFFTLEFWKNWWKIVIGIPVRKQMTFRKNLPKAQIGLQQVFMEKLEWYFALMWIFSLLNLFVVHPFSFFLFSTKQTWETKLISSAIRLVCDELYDTKVALFQLAYHYTVGQRKMRVGAHNQTALIL